MGLLGGMMGAGQGMADFGKMGVAHAFETGRDASRLASQERMQASRDASEEARAKRIEEWKLEVELKKLDDPRFISASERKAKLEAEKAGATAEAQEQAKLRAKNSPEAIAAEERAHGRKLKEIGAEADAKAKAEKAKESGAGGWKTDQLQKTAYDKVATGMGLDSKSLLTVDDATHRKLARLTKEVVAEFNKNPDAGLPAAHDAVMERENAGQESVTKGKEVRKEVEKEAKDKAGLLSSDKTDFGPEGREAWIERETKRRLQEQSPTAPGGGGTMATPPIDRLKEGVITRFANGQSWTLKNGQPVQVK